MAQIDLKDAVVRIKDGSAQVGDVNYPPPAAPMLTLNDGGGTLTDGTYQVVITYVTAGGETTASASAMAVAAGGNDSITVTSPAAFTGATAYRVYFTAAGGSTFFLQNGAGTAIGVNYTQSTDPSTITANPPGTNTGTYPIGTTTIKVMTFTAEIDNNTRFTIVGDATIYTVTAHTPASGATTEITFTPALVASATHDEAITTEARRLDIVIGEGNLTYTETVTREYVRDRGRLDTVRDGDEEPVEVSFDFTWEFLRANTGEDPTVEDVLKKRGEASHWESTSADPCEPYAVDIEIEHSPDCEAVASEIIVIQDFRYESLEHDLREGQVSVSGRGNVTEATVTRV